MLILTSHRQHVPQQMPIMAWMAFGMLLAFRMPPPVEGVPYTETRTRIETVDSDASEWESDVEIL